MVESGFWDFGSSRNAQMGDFYFLHLVEQMKLNVQMWLLKPAFIDLLVCFIGFEKGYKENLFL